MAMIADRRDRHPCRRVAAGLDHRNDRKEGPSMAGESVRFGLRERPPTPAVRPFDLPPRLQPMLNRAGMGLAESFRGIASGDKVAPGLFALEQTDVSLAPVLEAVRSFIATLTAEQRKAACFAISDEAWRKW